MNGNAEYRIQKSEDGMEHDKEVSEMTFLDSADRGRI